MRREKRPGSKSTPLSLNEEDNVEQSEAEFRNLGKEEEDNG